MYEIQTTGGGGGVYLGRRVYSEEYGIEKYPEDLFLFSVLVVSDHIEIYLF